MTIRAIHAFVATLFVLAMATAGSAQALPAGWATKDVGAVGATGSATSVNNLFTVAGSGADVWGAADEFRFVYKTFTGDGSIVTQVDALDDVNSWVKAGVMMRETLSAGSRHAFMLVSAGKGLAFQRRTSTGGSSTHTAAGSGGTPYYVKLTRSGNTFTAYKSVDASSWTKIASQSISMASTIYVGLAVSSHVDGVLANATFERRRSRRSQRLRSRRPRQLLHRRRPPAPRRPESACCTGISITAMIRTTSGRFRANWRSSPTPSRT